MLVELFQALGDLLIQLHEGRGRLGAQGLQGVGREQAAERVQFLVQTLAIAAQLTLLIDQVLGRLLTGGLGAAQLLPVSWARRCV